MLYINVTNCPKCHMPVRGLNRVNFIYDYSTVLIITFLQNNSQTKRYGTSGLLHDECATKSIVFKVNFLMNNGRRIVWSPSKSWTTLKKFKIIQLRVKMVNRVSLYTVTYSLPGVCRFIYRQTNSSNLQKINRFYIRILYCNIKRLQIGQRQYITQCVL